MKAGVPQQCGARRGREKFSVENLLVTKSLSHRQIMDLSAKIENLYKIGPAYAKKLHSLGIKTVRDLLFYFPFRYDDFSQITKIAELELGGIFTTQGKVIDINNTRTFRKKMVIIEVLIEDSSGVIKAVWFNQPFLKITFRLGMIINLSGKVTLSRDELIFSNPAYEIVRYNSGDFNSYTHTGRFVPVYHETHGLSSRWLRFHIKPLLGLAKNLKEFLPPELLKSRNLLVASEAIREIHFPQNMEWAEKARWRFAFEKLFLVHLWNFLQRKNWRENQSLSIPFREQVIKKFVKSLPFQLTNAQRKAAWQILQDLGKSIPMNRLLEGDVGSGKTIVAIIAVLGVTEQNKQAVLMAPTEVLAEQHYKTFNEYLKNYRIALLTGSKSLINDKKINLKKILEGIRNGSVDVVIGTHALIQDKVEFKNLALAIIDEQHRFGVEQRAKLVKTLFSLKDGLPNYTPHLLSMTATPIPRTLALTIYGDLDISLLDEMPEGRKKIITKIVAPASRSEAYNFIADEIGNGRQIFVICPLVEDSAVLEVKSAVTEYEKLRKIFLKFKIGLLHGRLKPKEKESVMLDYKNRKIDILVSTSVVEVGIDVPNATVIIIEGADRFGLAQLHQFRGRVGRGGHQSYCFLFTDSSAKKVHQRLNALIKCDNGFELAEKDLKIRGPGEVYGIRQSGIPDFTMANLSDVKLIIETRQEAKNIFGKDPVLKNYPQLQEKLKEFAKIIHLE